MMTVADFKDDFLFPLLPEDGNKTGCAMTAVALAYWWLDRAASNLPTGGDIVQTLNDAVDDCRANTPLCSTGDLEHDLKLPVFFGATVNTTERNHLCHGTAKGVRTDKGPCLCYNRQTADADTHTVSSSEQYLLVSKILSKKHKSIEGVLIQLLMICPDIGCFWINRLNDSGIDKRDLERIFKCIYNMYEQTSYKLNVDVPKLRTVPDNAAMLRVSLHVDSNVIINKDLHKYLNARILKSRSCRNRTRYGRTGGQPAPNSGKLFGYNAIWDAHSLGEERFIEFCIKSI